MKNFRTYTFSATETPASLKKQYGQLRYKCFDSDDPNVNMDTVNAVEFDRFDENEATIYIMVTELSYNSAEKLINAVRLIPTEYEYELEADSYLYLTHDIDLPKSPQVWESARWVGQSTRTVKGKIGAGLLAMGMYATLKNRGVIQMIGVITRKAEQFMEKRNTNTERKSALYYSERDQTDLMITMIDVDKEFYNHGKKLFDDAFIEDSVELHSISLSIPEAA